MPSKNQDLAIPSPQFAEEQDHLPSPDLLDLVEDKSSPVDGPANDTLREADPRENSLPTVAEDLGGSPREPLS